MIGRNRHEAGEEPKPRYEGNLKARMPGKYREMIERVGILPKGKKALKLYSKFWGIPYPTEIREFDVPGPNKTVVFVGMGTTPNAVLADGPKGQAKRKWKLRGKRIPAVDATGKKIWLFTGRSLRARNRGGRKRLGFVPETHYVPTGDMEQAGTFKRNTYWVHKHDDEGGKWPEAYQDAAGNIEYVGGTCSVGKWMRR